MGQVVGGRERQRRREAFGHVPGAGRAAADAPFGRGLDPGDEPQQGGLAAAVAALDADEGAAREFQRDPAQHPGSAPSVAAAHLGQVQCAVTVSTASLGRTMTKPSPLSFSWTASPEPPRIIEPTDWERCRPVSSWALQPTTASVST